MLTLDEADAATRGCVALIRDIVDAGIERNISLKLTQLGLDVDHATAVDNLRKVLALADRHDFFIRIDMEGSPYTQETLDIWETLWGLGHRRLGVVLQSALRRSEADAKRVIEQGGRIRLVKGAYKEPKAIAYQTKADVDDAFVRIMRTLLKDADYPAIATHDPAMIAATKACAAELGLALRSLRVPDAVRRPARSAGRPHGGGPSRARLHPVRPRVVPVLHAAPRRTPGQRRLRRQEPAAGTVTPGRRQAPYGRPAWPSFLQVSVGQPIS